MSSMRCGCGRLKSPGVEQCSECVPRPDVVVGVAIVALLSGRRFEDAVERPFTFCAFNHGCDCTLSCRVYVNLRTRHLAWKATKES